MRKILAIMIMLLFACSMLAVVAEAKKSTPDSYTISGKALECRPTEGIEITLLDKNGEEVGKAYSDSEGRYVIGNIQPGEYQIASESDDYYGKNRNIKVKANRRNPDLHRDVSANFPKSYTILGEAKIKGKPDEGIKVMLLKDGEEIASAYSESEGVYSIENVEPGRYELASESENYYGKDKNINIKSKRRNSDVYRNLNLVFPKGYTISGKAKLKGQPAEGMKVTLLENGEETASAYSDSEGSYELSDVEPGRYEIMAETECFEAHTKNIKINSKSRNADIKRNFNVRKQTCEILDFAEPTCEGNLGLRIDIQNYKNWREGDMSDSIYAGGQSYASDELIPLVEDGEFITDDSINEDFGGLALQRGEGYVHVYMKGSHEREGTGRYNKKGKEIKQVKGKEAVNGLMKLEGGDWTEFQNPSDRKVYLERQGDNNHKFGRPNQDEVYFNAGESEQEFVMSVTTKDDSFYMAYDCHEAEEEPEEQEQPEEPVVCEEGTGWATSVAEYNEGTINDGGAIDEERANPEKALCEAEDDDTLNFVSLGFDGSLTLGFTKYIINSEGNDVKVVETSFGSPSCGSYPEKAKVYASQDGEEWQYLGSGCLDAEYDLGELSWAKYIKLEDNTDRSDFNNEGDGFDVDGVQALNYADEQPAEDTTAPVVTLDEHDELIAESTYTFTGTVDDSTADVEVNSQDADVEGNTWSIELDFADGNHTLSVTAEDEAGNEAEPVTSEIAVDTTAPDTFIDEVQVNGTEVDAEYHGTESVYSTKIDDSEWSNWTESHYVSFEGLEAGEHMLYVRSMDDAGNIDPTPAEYSFTIEQPEATVVVIEDDLDLYMQSVSGITMVDLGHIHMSHYWNDGTQTKGFIKFDTSMIPEDAQIESATLQLTHWMYNVAEHSTQDEFTYNAHRIVEYWDENTRYEGDAFTHRDGLFSTSPEIDPSIAGTVDGVNPCSGTTCVYNEASHDDFVVEMDITGLVQDWASGEAVNHGLALSTDLEGAVYTNGEEPAVKINNLLYGNGAEDPNNEPKIVVEYY